MHQKCIILLFILTYLSAIINISNMYNWVGVVDFLQKHFENNDLQKKEWALQKNLYQKKVAELEAQIAAGDSINLDLLKRIQILETCLRDERRNRHSPSLEPQSKIEPSSELTTSKKNNQHVAFLEKILLEAGISKNDIHSIQAVEESVFHRSEEVVHCLVGHLDQVRGLFYQPKSKCLVSVSQDCLIKFWDYSKLDKKQYYVESNLTMRENTGQILTIAGTDETDANSVVFSGGIQGIIKCWQTTSQSIAKSSCLKGEWINYKEEETETIIWQLAYLNNHLLCSSSNSQIRLYNIQYQYKHSMIAAVKEKLVNSYISKNIITNSANIPTSICWVDKNSFVNGHSNSNIINKWDINTSSVVGSYKYTLQNKIQPGEAQSNKILYNPTNNIIVSAHEDGQIRGFDSGSGKMIKSLQHKSSVSCMAIPRKSPWQLFSGSHNGSVYLWDIRKNQLVKQIKNMHERKYDQCIQALSLVEEKNLLLSGGADSLIKALEY